MSDRTNGLIALGVALGVATAGLAAAHALAGRRRLRGGRRFVEVYSGRGQSRRVTVPT